MFTKERRAEKQLFAEAQKDKRQPAKEKHHGYKKDTYSKLRVVVAERRDEANVDVDE
jgi:hypothetical protein